ncbi:MAG: 50S ribosomal protein L22 [Candidatus Jacksonbacteria bacterium RIFCSPLOWO2_02_FULL_43_9]|nr:MAG: 50S ribosomal protein L22 [Candidatus Jacksonbacteria bacterium RIFCSPHIGHO2_02_FULL_43_10]OGY70501.1 MAG: 50S ribosomal protein L22 [Candidatus Jacksonbacteria bacterium RIFCSPLOWO2_01_FULL_44_13]OGY72827.1 MAG: 50S ribosomal protein L22 [Candidatus Jacksonbacteria bacterium RIFCSPLOWO2_02_FULL_43_9]HAZ17077.1 50S ribosomal protein L22 [Candidatus Jacksonbacteria bacterium]
MEVKASARQIRISPRKVRLVLAMIRKMKAEDALAQLVHSSKEAARPVFKILQSAIANAEHNLGMNRAMLVIKIATAQDGQTLSRWMPRAHGRATPLRKRSSHITLVLEGPDVHKDKEQSASRRTKNSAKGGSPAKGGHIASGGKK